MKKILALTTNFGYGPVSKLNAILDILSKTKEFEIKFVGSGESLEFFKRNENKNLSILDLNMEKVSNHKFESISKGFDLIINVMNLHVQSFLKEKNSVPIIFVDSLDWMWKEPIPGIENLDTYFVQDSSLDFKTDNDRFSKNMIIVNPILMTEVLDKKNEILVNFSGIYTPDDNNFGIVYAKLYIDIFKFISEYFNIKVTFACNTYQYTRLSKLKSNKLDFKILSHDEFLYKANNCKYVFSTPGLTFYLESKKVGIDVYYLLPSNYSQAILLDKYKQASKLRSIDFSSKLIIKRGLNEYEGVNLVRKYFEQIDKNLIIDSIKKYINDKKNKNLNGATQIANNIRKKYIS